MRKAFAKEYQNLLHFYPCCLLLGIITYFTLHKLSLNISWLIAAFIAISLSFILILRLKNKLYLRYILSLIICYCFGIIISYWQIIAKQHNTLSSPIYASITGVVKATKPNNRGGRQITLEISNLSKYADMKRVRVTTNHSADQHQILVGSKVKLRAKLMPPPTATIKGGYDFAFHSYFNQIAATGYAIKPLVILDPAQQNLNFFTYLRQILYQRLQNVMEKDNSAIISAIMLGESGAISSNIIDNMRYSGISHILCVSGLHLSLIAGITLLSCRILLNCSNFIAYNLNIKLLSGACSLIVSFAYLMLTGGQIAATRAFIMTSFMIAAFSIGRGNYPMRSLSIAAICILFLHPEYALHPSFQLSFVAVIALISGFEIFQTYQTKILSPIGGIFAKIRLFILSNLYSSVIASLATGPIVIYHFHIISNYTLLANLLAIPLMSFYIMPLVLLAFCLMPLGLDAPILHLLAYGATRLIKIAAFTTSMPNPVIYFGAISGGVLLLFICGFLWLSLLRSKLRLLGLIPIISAIIVICNNSKPDVIFNPQENIIALRQQDQLKLYGNKLGKYITNYWSSWFGFKRANVIKQNIEQSNHCLKIKEATIAILYRHATDDFCADSKLSIYATQEAASSHSNVLSYDQLQKLLPSVSISCKEQQCYAY